MRHGKHSSVLGPGMERVVRIYDTSACQPSFHQVTSGTQERHQGRPVDSRVPVEKTYQGEFCIQSSRSGYAQAEPSHLQSQRGSDLQQEQASRGHAALWVPP